MRSHTEDSASTSHQDGSELSSNNIDSRSSIVPSVLIRNATKRYGFGKGSCSVLDGLDMNVQKGSM